jgi:hypothetical protein
MHGREARQCQYSGPVSAHVTIVWSAVVGPTVIGRGSTTPSGFTTHVKTALNSRRRNGQDVAARVDEDARVDEVSRPQFIVLVGKHRLETNRGTGLINDIVDQQQRTLANRIDVVLAERRHLHWASRTSLSERAERVNTPATGFVSVKVAMMEESAA